jgi:hypothetical protein
MKSLFVICVLALALQVYCGEYKPVIEPFDSTWTARWAIPAENQKGKSSFLISENLLAHVFGIFDQTGNTAHYEVLNTLLTPLHQTSV